MKEGVREEETKVKGAGGLLMEEEEEEKRKDSEGKEEGVETRIKV